MCAVRRALQALNYKKGEKERVAERTEAERHKSFGMQFIRR